jgi:hypothetical protein
MPTAKSWIRCLLMTICVLKGADAGAIQRLTALIYDRAHVGKKTLNQAESLASGIFARAGIEARWEPGPGLDSGALLNEFSAATGQICAQPLHSAALLVEILPYAPRGFSPQALGYALPCAKTGMQVTIYADRVETVSRTTLAGYYRVLGHALAHEIGHVLLRSGAHDASGLMKGVWAKSHWQRAAVSVVPFTRGQSRFISEQLRRLEAYNTPGLLHQQNQRGDVVVLASAADKSVDR